MKNYFSFLPPRPTQLSPKTIKLHPPHAPCRSNLLSCPSFIEPVCFLLIVVCDLFVGGRLRPRCILFSTFFVIPFAACNDDPTQSTPVVPPLQRTPHHWHQLLVDCCVFQLNGSNFRPRHPPSINLIFFYPNCCPKWRKNILPTCYDPAASNHQCPSHCRHYHSVGCWVMTAKQWPPKPRHAPLCIFWCLSFCPPKLMNQQYWAQAWRLATCVWHWGVAAPRFGGAAALPMEREGKAAGGRAAADFVGCCLRCVLYFVLCCGCEQV
jgi:hypothetical protein